MKNISLETQLNALYDKAKVKKAQNETPHSEGSSQFNSTLQSTIQRMNAITDHADSALKSLPSTNKKEALQKEMEQAGSIHRKIMREQHNLSALYQKLQLQKPDPSS